MTRPSLTITQPTAAPGLGRARRLAAVPALGPRLSARRPRRHRLAEVEVVAARLRPLLPLVLRVRPLAAVGPLRRRRKTHEGDLRDRHLLVEGDGEVGG